MRPLAPLANALLRRLAREGGRLRAGLDAPRRDTPPWLWRRWTSAYGEETARAIAEAHLAGDPPLDLSCKRAPAAWAGRLGATLLPWGSLRLRHRGPVEELDGYAEGAWWVQDAAAALPVRLLGTVAGRRVVELCAAPGGKTAQLAAAGAKVMAVDSSGPRLARLSENMARLGLSARVEAIEADARSYTPPAPASHVLLDAPCTATGTIRRHPDVAWRRAPGDVARAVSLQTELLAGAAAMLAPGGILVYAACSIEPEECEAQARRLLAADPAVERLPVRPAEVGGHRELVSEAGDLRTLPCHLAAAGGLDGFYAVRLRRRG